RHEVALAGERDDDVALLQARRACGLAARLLLAPVDEVLHAHRERRVTDAELLPFRGGERGAAEAGRRRQVPLERPPRVVLGRAALPAVGERQLRVARG